jgi:rod shape-determining protein MreC
MSPIIKRKGERFTLPSKYLLFILTILCTVLMLVTFGNDSFDKPLNTVVGYVIVPLQQGIGKVGLWLADRSDELEQIRTVLNENTRLKEEIAALTEENTLLQQDKYELNKLRELFDLNEQYSSYNKVGARIIGRDSGNWYSGFVIDKGENDGLAVDMNVIAGGGLVGRITSVGPNWSKVTSIISDNSHVSAMTLSSEDNMTVSGDLKLMAEGCIAFSRLMDTQNKVREGDKIVTSNISDKYLPNILIGYVSSIEKDANNLTKSGLLVPAVDFEHLGEVLVITDMKQAPSSTETEQEPGEGL